MAHMSHPDRFGEAIRHRRRELGIPRRHVAAAAHLSLERLNQLERGELVFVPAPDRLFGLSQVLNLSQGTLLLAMGYDIENAAGDGTGTESGGAS
jgi:transcriptional regulator with XRE-family HTH domain